MKFPPFEPINLKNDGQVVELLLSKIVPDQFQPRKTFDAASLEELAQSIKQHGILQPIIVKEITKGEKYQLIAGERRWRAAGLAGLEKIPVIIKDFMKSNTMTVSLIENIQREDLNPLEEAHALQSLVEESNMTHGEVAENIGKSRASVSNLLRLLLLTPEVKEMVNSGLLEMGHARALLAFSENEQIKMAELIISKSLSVRESEKLVQAATNQNKRQSLYLSPDFKKKASNWEDRLSSRLETRVNVKLNSDGKGRVVIYFDSIEEAEGLMKKISYNEMEEV